PARAPPPSRRPGRRRRRVVLRRGHQRRHDAGLRFPEPGQERQQVVRAWRGAGPVVPDRDRPPGRGGARRGPDRMTAVEPRGLYHTYRERGVETVALRGADLRLDPGSWTSVMGPSGSGKSTLVHVIGGLLEPSGGSVLIGGEDITRLPAAERAVRRRR